MSSSDEIVKNIQDMTCQEDMESKTMNNNNIDKMKKIDTTGSGIGTRCGKFELYFIRFVIFQGWNVHIIVIIQ